MFHLKTWSVSVKEIFSRRDFLTATAAGVTTVLPKFCSAPFTGEVFSQSLVTDSNEDDHIVDIHVHFDDKSSSFVEDLLKVCNRLHMTACVLTPYANRSVIADAAKRYPAQIVPIGFVDLDEKNAVQQVKEFHKLGYRGLGELEFVKKAFTDPAYIPVYELANDYGWLVLFHTGIVLRRKFDEPEDVASHRMRAFHMEEIARRFPRITVVGAHCGNPEYEWAAEVARWNPNVFFDLSGSTLQKLSDRLSDFRKIFWWSETDWGTKSPDNDPSAFSKLVFGSDTPLDRIEGAVGLYRSLFQACGVPEHTQKLIMGGTLSKIFNLTK
jgi:predicted TIM-barrel fold metal-dependent hydrolase